MSKRTSMEGVIAVVLLLACSLITSSAYPLCASNLGMYMSYLLGALCNSLPGGNSHVFCMQLRANAFPSLSLSCIMCNTSRIWHSLTKWRVLLIFVKMLTDLFEILFPYIQSHVFCMLLRAKGFLYLCLSCTIVWEDDIYESESYHSLSKVKIGGHLCDGA